MLWHALLCLEVCLAGGVYTDVIRTEGIYRPEDARCLPWIPCERRLDEETLAARSSAIEVEMAPSTTTEVIDTSEFSQLEEMDNEHNFTIIELGDASDENVTFIAPSDSMEETGQVEPKSRSATESGSETTTEIATEAPTDASTSTSTEANTSSSPETTMEPDDRLKPRAFVASAGLIENEGPYGGSDHSRLHSAVHVYEKKHFDRLSGETEICECRRVRLQPKAEVHDGGSAGVVIRRPSKRPIVVTARPHIETESGGNRIIRRPKVIEEVRPIHDQGHAIIKRPVNEEITYVRPTTPRPLRIPLVTRRPIGDKVTVIDREGGHLIRQPQVQEIEASGGGIWESEHEDGLCIMLKRLYAAQMRKQSPYARELVSFGQIHKHVPAYGYDSYPGSYAVGSYKVNQRPGAIQRVKGVYQTGLGSYREGGLTMQGPAYETKWTSEGLLAGIDKDLVKDVVVPEAHSQVNEVVLPETQTSWRKTLNNNNGMMIQQIVKGGHAAGGAQFGIVKKSIRGPVYKTSWSSGPVKTGYSKSWSRSGGSAINGDAYETNENDSATSGYRTSWQGLPKGERISGELSDSQNLEMTYQEKLPDEVILESRVAKVDNESEASTVTINIEKISPEDMTLNGPGCGQSLTLRSRIVNGQEAPEGRFPWLIHLKIVRGSQFVCAASLITPRFLVTAAHCILQGGKYPTSISAGYGNVNKDQAQYVAVSSFKLYPRYSKVPYEKHDIALLKLAHRLDVRQARPICIAEQMDTNNQNHFSDMETELATVAGWGVDKAKGGKSSTVLKYAKLNILPSERCAQSPKLAKVMFDQASQICTFGNETDTCFGDSGGPVMAPIRMNETSQIPNRRMEQRGIVSFGFSCASPTPAVATRLEFYLDWIKSSFKGWHSDPEVLTLETPTLDEASSSSKAGESSTRQQHDSAKTR